MQFPEYNMNKNHGQYTYIKMCSTQRCATQCDTVTLWERIIKYDVTFHQNSQYKR